MGLCPRKKECKAWESWNGSTTSKDHAKKELVSNSIASFAPQVLKRGPRGGGDTLPCPMPQAGVKLVFKKSSVFFQVKPVVYCLLHVPSRLYVVWTAWTNQSAPKKAAYYLVFAPFPENREEHWKPEKRAKNTKNEEELALFLRSITFARHLRLVQNHLVTRTASICYQNGQNTPRFVRKWYKPVEFRQIWPFIVRPSNYQQARLGFFFLFFVLRITASSLLLI